MFSSGFRGSFLLRRWAFTSSTLSMYVLFPSHNYSRSADYQVVSLASRGNKRKGLNIRCAIWSRGTIVSLVSDETDLWSFLIETNNIAPGLKMPTTDSSPTSPCCISITWLQSCHYSVIYEQLRVIPQSLQQAFVVSLTGTFLLFSKVIALSFGRRVSLSFNRPENRFVVWSGNAPTMTNVSRDVGRIVTNGFGTYSSS